jgi:predicted transcriptional regulator
VDRSIIDSRSLVVLLMRAHGTLSRVELAPLTGLTVAAMTNIVRDLLLDGLIEEAGSSGNTGGNLGPCSACEEKRGTRSGYRSI